MKFLLRLLGLFILGVTFRAIFILEAMSLQYPFHTAFQIACWTNLTILLVSQITSRRLRHAKV